MAIPDPQPEGGDDAAYAEPESEPEPEGSTAGASGMSATIMTLAVSMVSYALSKWSQLILFEKINRIGKSKNFYLANFCI